MQRRPAGASSVNLSIIHVGEHGSVVQQETLSTAELRSLLDRPFRCPLGCGDLNWIHKSLARHAVARIRARASSQKRLRHVSVSLFARNTLPSATGDLRSRCRR
jgi:hypothetical protein